MWYIHIKDNYGAFIPVIFFDCLSPESSGLDRRKELAESLGFTEGEDTHHFIKEETEIRLMWHRVNLTNISHLKIREDGEELLDKCKHRKEVFELKYLLIHD